MSKIFEIKPMDIEKNVMNKIKSKEIIMKPRWYFVLGSILMIAGLAGIIIGSVFSFNIIFFLLKKHGPMGQWKLQSLLNSFPWWILLIAIVGLILGIYLLKKYDFSYKKNFYAIVIGFMASIIISALLVNYLGLNEILYQKGYMRRFYQSIEGKENHFPTEKEGRRRINGQGKRFYQQNR